MAATPQAFTPARAIEEIADFIADPVEAADFPEARLRFRNDRAATEVGLDGLTDEAWIEHFGRFVPLPGSLPHPLALRYHGHQFRVYNPDIGDGRGFLFGQCRDLNGRLMDFGTKGSGTTPYSRFGDGRLTLKGAVREILATEMLEALGVPTSRTFSVIETGEKLHRGDEPSPTRSAVLVRLNHGHIRIGSFQRLATLGQRAELERLVAYSLKHYFDEHMGGDGPVRLLGLVAERTARMAAAFMTAGFVHGVLNSDNINITGESFDYGPWRFAPTFDAGFTAAYFDSSGLYAFGRQAEAIHWDLVQLAIALAEIADSDALAEAVDRFGPAYRNAIVDRMLWRLGVVPIDNGSNVVLVQAMEAALVATQCPLDEFFFDWRGGDLRRESPAYAGDKFAPFRVAVAPFAPVADTGHPYWSQPGPCSMHIDEVEDIWAQIADCDDWTALETKVTEIRRMGAAHGLRHDNDKSTNAG
ncbi:protein adenylyltransferase SelO family protein [Sphingomonas sp. SUN039]|uniref:protein adenylyltransferase SelO family protein n=1 Tax=Sphingomonas sp. SUN039 TaxID=2937787 RepID=UPI0021645FCD|nr:YdiU family protein [Sphingomonas sp. SUN039]UVO53950.1 YdiU family protein [Sphingomonas sp. SUN039]